MGGLREGNQIWAYCAGGDVFELSGREADEAEGEREDGELHCGCRNGAKISCARWRGCRNVSVEMEEENDADEDDPRMSFPAPYLDSH